ncbi:hypothetical protein BN1723_020003 [Verticillium longisporum]|uniref:Uncharacterized protein n=1 Tax=Verticillium longisporum TaxID=100787 RepID=A0A0G4NIZ4_VERLO|nr:hypothetical protein BN1723_020003 [Verticillium longisporum]
MLGIVMGLRAIM